MQIAVEILKDEIKLPAHNNLTWIFPVRVNGREEFPWKVDSFDLNIWFKEEIGRYPRHERGDKDEKDDILENWPRLEPRLRSEAEKEIGLPFRIAVDGMRFSARCLDEARSIPANELPPLSDPQREGAKSMGISEEEYARSLVAGERTWNLLLEKTERLANFLQERLALFANDAKLRSVILRTFDEKFDVEVLLHTQAVHLSVRESVVDDLFEAGSAEADSSLNRILELALPRQAKQ